MRNLILLVAISILAFGCGSSDGGNNGLNGGIPGTGLPALTDGQKSSVHNFTASYNDIQTMVGADDQQGSQPLRAKAWGQASAQIYARASEKGLAMKSKLDKAIFEARCNRDYQQSDFGEPEQREEMTIKGNGCPINFRTLEITKTDENSGTTNSTMEDSYTAFPGMEVYNDTMIHKYEAKGSGSSVISNQTQNAATVNFNFSSRGYSETHDKGKVDVGIATAGTANISVENEKLKTTGHMDTTHDFTFSDFRAVGVVKRDLTDGKNSKYYVNGVEVTRSEFEFLFGKQAEDL